MTDDERIERALKSIGDAYVRENPPNYPAFREGVFRRQRRRRWFQAGSAVALAGATVAIGLFFSQPAPLDRAETAPAGNDVTEAITATVDVGESPTQINVGRGAVWVTSKSGYVTRIDPATKTRDLIEVGGLPTDLAVGGSGVWIANNGVLQRLALDGTDREDFPIVQGTARMHVSVAPGAIWVVVGGESVFRVDPDNGQTQAFEAGPSPVDIAVGEGTVWVLGASGRIQGFDVESGRALGDPVDVPAAANAEITLGSGALWYGAQGSETFVRIDLETRASHTVTLPSGYVDMGVGRGEVWVLMLAGEETGSFVSLDPRNGRRAGPVYSVAGSPVDIAVGRQALWVVNGTGHTAQRVQKSSLET